MTGLGAAMTYGGIGQAAAGAMQGLRIGNELAPRLQAERLANQEADLNLQQRQAENAAYSQGGEAVENPLTPYDQLVADKQNAINQLKSAGQGKAANQALGDLVGIQLKRHSYLFQIGARLAMNDPQSALPYLNAAGMHLSNIAQNPDKTYTLTHEDGTTTVAPQNTWAAMNADPDHWLSNMFMYDRLNSTNAIAQNKQNAANLKNALPVLGQTASALIGIKDPTQRKAIIDANRKGIEATGYDPDSLLDADDTTLQGLKDAGTPANVRERTQAQKDLIAVRQRIASLQEAGKTARNSVLANLRQEAINNKAANPGATQSYVIALYNEDHPNAKITNAQEAGGAYWHAATEDIANAKAAGGISGPLGVLNPEQPTVNPVKLQAPNPEANPSKILGPSHKYPNGTRMSINDKPATVIDGNWVAD